MPVPTRGEASPAPSPALQPPPGNPRFPLFDSLRALAALAVVGCHLTGAYASEQTTAWGPFTIQLLSGVQVFFVISGFLLYRPFVSARMNGRPLNLGAFARRRILRIVPAYWFALTALALWPGGALITGVLGDRWWAYYGFGQLYSTQTAVHGLGVAWSLCTEVAFYLVLPLYAILASVLCRRLGLVRGELLGLGLTAVLSLTFLGLSAEHVVALRLYPTLPGCWYMFTAGMGLAVASVALGQKSPRLQPLRILVAWPGVSWLLAGGFLCLAATAFSYDWSSLGVKSIQGNAVQMIGNGASSVAMAFFIVLPAVFGQHEGGLVRRLLASRTLTWVGVVSYGIYLWHLPFISWIAMPLKHAVPTAVSQHPGVLTLLLGTAALGLTLVAASFSYYIVELPFLRYKEVTLRSLLRRRPLAKPA